ncbi:uncharacterized protein A4U43_UnF3820 [Asparagus officinalis]|uniref:Uncharacterized protein n=1 Tax=Asparagus officinalis TaxID=4686 RepID=A0A1R3L6Z9_ASPOF|nr:uncharacterized protein A4U43_UnF3820 [Asparagus officinalis]
MAICAPSADSSSAGSKSGWIVHGRSPHGLGLRWFSRKSRSKVIRIIPVWFASSQFEGKPLVLILGKLMIQRAKLASTLDHVVFAPLVPMIGYREVLALSGYVLSNVAFVLAAVFLYSSLGDASVCDRTVYNPVPLI